MQWAYCGSGSREEQARSEREEQARREAGGQVRSEREE
jgi:hypothetical protein